MRKNLASPGFDPLTLGPTSSCSAVPAIIFFKFCLGRGANPGSFDFRLFSLNLVAPKTTRLLLPPCRPSFASTTLPTQLDGTGPCFRVLTYDQLFTARTSDRGNLRRNLHLDHRSQKGFNQSFGFLTDVEFQLSGENSPWSKLGCLYRDKLFVVLACH